MTAYQPDALIAADIDAYLATHAAKSMLRFITCGSVDDGKSTLIGRLLYDSKTIFEDQLSQLIEQSQFGHREHVGRIPRKMHTPSHNEIRARKLMRELDAAVTAEQYERAAELRDRLNELTTNVEPEPESGPDDG